MTSAPDFEARGAVRRWNEAQLVTERRLTADIHAVYGLMQKRLWSGRRLAPEDVTWLIKTFSNKAGGFAGREGDTVFRMHMGPAKTRMPDGLDVDVLAPDGIRLQVDRRRINWRMLGGNPVVFLQHCQERIYRRAFARDHAAFLRVIERGMQGVRPYFQARLRPGSFAAADLDLPVVVPMAEGVLLGRRRIKFASDTQVGTLADLPVHPEARPVTRRSQRYRTDVEGAPGHEFSVHFQTFVDWDALAGAREGLARDLMPLIADLPADPTGEWWFAAHGEPAPSVADRIDRVAREIVLVMSRSEHGLAMRELRASDSPSWLNVQHAALRKMEPPAPAEMLVAMPAMGMGA